MKSVFIRRMSFLLILIISISSLPLIASAKQDEVLLIMLEFRENDKGSIIVNAIPVTDDSGSNDNYVLLPFKRSTTTNYYINPSNKYGFTSTQVVAAITSSATEWDDETNASVFNYKGVTSIATGKRDGLNIVGFGTYKKGVIGVTYIWYIGTTILETDTRLNTLYKWSLTSESSKMDVVNIMTHEFGHWFGLGDMYEDENYWLTMYGYSGYGVTYQRSIGYGDILGLQKIYGA